MSDEFYKKHRFLARAIDKVVGKLTSGWVHITESDVATWEASSKAACRVDCLKNTQIDPLCAPES